MNHKTLIAVNTFAQFTRTLVNVGLTFYSTRIVLEALGNSNYGLYTLIAGVVFLLSFITNALSTTTQRFLSYHQGENNLSNLQKIFSNAVFIHLILSILILVILEVAGIFLFDGFLNITNDQIYPAKITYQCVIFMVLCTCVTSPFRGLLISHQNLVYTSVIDVLDGVLKLIIALFILYCNFLSNILIEYAILMAIISVFNLCSFSIYCFIKYRECVIPKFCDWSFLVIKKMSRFAGWLIYSTFMIVGRNQGTAIVLNKFLGTFANTAFGLATQLNSACIFISGSILTAFNPHIIKSEGEQKREVAIRYAQTASKLCYLLMFVVVIPLCIYMEPVLKLWLGNVPPYSVTLGRIVILTTLCDQITTGLSVINKAIGKLKVYSLTVDTVKILTIPIMGILLYFGVPVNLAFWSFLFFELLSALLRLPILKREANISISIWLKNVIGKLSIPTLIVIVYYIFCNKHFSSDISTIVCVVVVGSCTLFITSYFFSLDTVEKGVIRGFIMSAISKFKK